MLQDAPFSRDALTSMSDLWLSGMRRPLTLETDQAAGASVPSRRGRGKRTRLLTHTRCPRQSLWVLMLQEHGVVS